MAASTSSVEAGKWLRAARIAVRLSTREVERLSRQIAQNKASQDYYVSHAWIADLEKGGYSPSIYKLYSLSIIYKRDYMEILACFGIDLRDIARQQFSLSLPHTHLIPSRGDELQIELPPELKDETLLKKTNLVSQMFKRWGEIPISLLSHMNANAIYGYVGIEDFTLYPLIRPGSFVEIDAKQRKIDQRSWLTEFERPIYFVELRQGYACSWCEMREDRLLLVPHPQSRSRVREIRYPVDGEIIGRVTAVSMRMASAI